MRLVRAPWAARLPRPIAGDQIMDRTIDAAVGGSDRRRTSGDAAVAMAGVEGAALLSMGEAPRALVRARARAAAR